MEEKKEEEEARKSFWGVPRLRRRGFH